MSIRVSWNTVKVKLSGNAKKHGGPNGIVVQANDLQKQMGFFQDYGLGQATSKRGWLPVSTRKNRKNPSLSELWGDAAG